jgi:hypothetical protein
VQTARDLRKLALTESRDGAEVLTTSSSASSSYVNVVSALSRDQQEMITADVATNRR